MRPRRLAGRAAVERVRRPVSPAVRGGDEIESPDGREGQLYRACLVELTREASPPADGWTRLAERLHEPAPVKPVTEPWLLGPMSGWPSAARFAVAFAPMFLVGILSSWLLLAAPADDESAFDYSDTAPLAVREPGFVVPASETVEPRQVREWRTRRVLAYAESLDTIESTAAPSQAAPRSRPGTGAVSPRELMPGVPRDLINPFGVRPRPAAGEPKLPLRPGQFRFTTA